METEIEKFSLEDVIQGMGKEKFEVFADTIRPVSYQVWINALYKSLAWIAKSMTQDARHFKGLNEEALNKLIVNKLSENCFEASAETDSGGHVDIYVKKNGWVWCGEAKIFDNGSHNYLAKGIRQLLHRYAGSDRHGGLIIYLKDGVLLEIKNEWRKKIKENKYKNMCFKSILEDKPSSLWFCSLHTHPTIGSEYEIRHIFITLKYEPKD